MNKFEKSNKIIFFSLANKLIFMRGTVARRLKFRTIFFSIDIAGLNGGFYWQLQTLAVNVLFRFSLLKKGIAARLFLYLV